MPQDPYEIPPQPIEAPPNIPSASRSIWPTIAKFGVGIAILLLVASLFLPATRQVPEAARRTQCRNNLKNIGLALHNYRAAHGEFPPAYTIDADGNRLHSWRTLILPYLDQQELFDRIDLDKPWDHPANQEAYDTGIYSYHCLSSDRRLNFTTYLALVGPNRCLGATEPRTASEITDEPSETLMIVDVGTDKSVHWMEPADVEGELSSYIQRYKGFGHTSVFQVAFADGSTRAISRDIDAQALESLATIAGSEQIDSEF